MRCLYATALVAAALLLAACGGDDDSASESPEKQPTATTQPETRTGSTEDSGSTGDSPTREEYIARADAFCKQANAEAKGLNERLQEAVRGASPGREQLEAIAPILEEGYEVQRRSRAEFKEIPSPPADRETIEKLHAAYDEQTAIVGRLRDAAEAGDVARFRALSQEQNRVKLQSRSLAQRYGFKECGSGRNEAD